MLGIKGTITEPKATKKHRPLSQPTVVLDEAEYHRLKLVQEVAKTLLARYPFDTEDEMHERWRMLALYLSMEPEA